MPWPMSRYQGPLLAAISMPASFQQRQLGLMRARAVAARHEWRAFRLDRLERGDNILGPIDAAWVALGTDKDEVVAHHGEAFHAVAFGHELLLSRARMDEHDVGTATTSGIERLPRSLGDDLHGDAGPGFEQRQHVVEEAGVQGRSGRGDHDRFFLGGGRSRQREADDDYDQAAAAQHHRFSGFTIGTVQLAIAENGRHQGVPLWVMSRLGAADPVTADSIAPSGHARGWLGASALCQSRT